MPLSHRITRIELRKLIYERAVCVYVFMWCVCVSECVWRNWCFGKLVLLFSMPFLFATIVGGDPKFVINTSHTATIAPNTSTSDDDDSNGENA